METVKIRKAERKDCTRIMELVHELATFERAPDEVTASLQHFEESGFGTHPVWWAFVAEVDGVVAGFALYYIRYSTWKGQRMYLEDIVITEVMRGRGLGSLLMKTLLLEARALGLNGVVWQVLRWNEAAMAFYRKFGAKFDSEWVNCSCDTL